jgi:hypothetical protein
MPYLQPATANYFGFQPAEDQAPPRIRVYLVSSTEASNINIGDLVCLTTDKNTVRVVASRAATEFTLGIAASRVIAGDGSTAADPRVLSTRTVAVYDDPNTIFYSGDTSSGVIGAGNHIGKSFQVAATGVTGSTGANPTIGRSVMAISGVTASSGSDASFRFRLIGLHPVENAWSTIAAATATTTGETRKLLLKPDFHLYNAGFGLGHVTT